ncbi:MAG TPA: hypothetical protein V6C97_34105, partial [Oculatellaceae cyanobacterium]
GTDVWKERESERARGARARDTKPSELELADQLGWKLSPEKNIEKDVRHHGRKDRETQCVCVWVWVWVRESERERERARARERE